MAIVATASATIGPQPASATLKVFGVTCLDADTGPTAFNHGIPAQAGGAFPIAILVPQVTAATTVIPNWGVTTNATQFTLSKQNIAGSGGAVPGTTVVLLVLVFAPQSLM